MMSSALAIAVLVGPRTMLLALRERHPTAAARVAAAAELSRVRIAGHRVDTAEEQVSVLPAHELVAAGRDHVQPLLVHSRLGLHRARLVVDAGRRDRALGVHAAGDHPDDGLEHRRADAVGT